MFRIPSSTTWLTALIIASIIPATPSSASIDAQTVTKYYVDMAAERYQHTYELARVLQKSIDSFVRAPSPATHAAAKDAWLDAHIAYSQTEVYRFGNPNADDWDSKVNAWPLDEGLIDYVAPNYLHEHGNPYATWNIIASRMPIYDEMIAELSSGTDPKSGPQGFADFESNVSIGFHAIEFLLWGQDLNENRSDAGLRSYTDYIQGEDCTNSNCKRRAQYLQAVSRVLSRDLMLATNDWRLKNKRLYAAQFLAQPVEEQLHRMLQGMGELSAGELAGERARVALITSDQEEEQSCFSDTTHHAIYYNALGIKTLYLGQHSREDDSTFEGPSLSTLVSKLDPALDMAMQDAFDVTMKRARAVLNSGESDEPFDVMIQANNTDGRKQIRELITALKSQTLILEKIQQRIPELAATP